MGPMNSIKKCSGAMNSSKNKLNSKISRLSNFCQTHTQSVKIVISSPPESISTPFFYLTTNDV